MPVEPSSFNMEEELGKIFSQPPPQGTPYSRELEQAFALANKELVTNDVTRYSSAAYQNALIYISILVHRLQVAPDKAITTLITDMELNLRKGFGV